MPPSIPVRASTHVIIIGGVSLRKVVTNPSWKPARRRSKKSVCSVVFFVFRFPFSDGFRKRIRRAPRARLLKAASYRPAALRGPDPTRADRNPRSGILVTPGNWFILFCTLVYALEEFADGRYERVGGGSVGSDNFVWLRRKRAHELPTSREEAAARSKRHDFRARFFTSSKDTTRTRTK